MRATSVSAAGMELQLAGQTVAAMANQVTDRVAQLKAGARNAFYSALQQCSGVQVKTRADRHYLATMAWLMAGTLCPLLLPMAAWQLWQAKKAETETINQTRKEATL